ncbi:MAG: 50S ribosomal protein L9 [Planctomycetota bacterium]
MARPYELLLLDTVDNLGIVGDVVKVKAGFARNYLLPRGLAEAPTPEKVEALAEQRAVVKAEMEKLAAEQAAMIEKLADHEITLERSANDSGVLFGGVSQHEVAELLREQGFAIEDRHVRLGETIKRIDNYDVPVVINKDLKTEIKLHVVSDRPLEDAETSEEPDAETDETAESSEAAEPAAGEDA